MTSIFDSLSKLSKEDNKVYREICIKILDHMLTYPNWVKHLNIYEITDQDCKTLEELDDYMRKLRAYLKGEIKNTGYHFLQWILEDPYFETEDQIPFFDMLHDESHRLATKGILQNDRGMLPLSIKKILE